MRLGLVDWAALEVAREGQSSSSGRVAKSERELSRKRGEEKGKPGTVNTPTDALRNVLCWATQGRERQERGGRRWGATTGTGWDGGWEKREARIETISTGFSSTRWWWW